MELNNISIPSLDVINQELARMSHLEFMRYTWQKPYQPFIIGRHTQEICARIDMAFDKLKRGYSSLLMFLVCFRHGKSDLGSRYLVPNFLGKFPDKEVLLVSHSATKAWEFSHASKRIMESPQYQKLYDVRIGDVKTKQEWNIAHNQGKAQYIGIGAGSAGMGGDLIIVDDYFGERADAESAVMREKIWSAFTDDIMTRRAPTSIVIIIVTPWHVDDIVGRIKQNMENDPAFPKFDIMNYPAFHPEYETGTLFPERFSADWYEGQKKLLGSYGYASLMQCNPVLRGGNLIKTDKIQIVDELPANLRYKRAWDLASGMKQQNDMTSGVKGSIAWKIEHGIRIPTLYIDDWKRVRYEALKRNELIQNTAIEDGYIDVGIEAFGAYKDAYTTLRDILTGVRQVLPIKLPGDKISKAEPLFPIFEAGNVIMKRAHWNEEVIKQLSEFPSGKHDDDVDALSCLVGMFEQMGTAERLG